MKKKKENKKDTQVQWSKAVYLWTLQGHIQVSALESFTYYGDWNCGKKFDIFAWKELSVKRHVQMRIYKEFINVFLSKKSSKRIAISSRKLNQQGILLPANEYFGGKDAQNEVNLFRPLSLS